MEQRDLDPEVGQWEIVERLMSMAILMLKQGWSPFIHPRPLSFKEVDFLLIQNSKREPLDAHALFLDVQRRSVTSPGIYLHGTEKQIGWGKAAEGILNFISISV